MSRLDTKLTHELWGVDYFTHAKAMREMNVIDYYELGLEKMHTHIRIIIHNRSWQEIVSAKDDHLLEEINKTKAFYEKRLKEK